MTAAPTRIWVTPQNPALILVYRGPQGLPKGAVLTHRNILAATMCTNLWGSHLNDNTPVGKRNVLTMLPFSHVYDDTEEATMEFCKDKLTVDKQAKIVEFRDSIPKSAKIILYDSDLEMAVERVLFGTFFYPCRSPGRKFSDLWSA